jgi:hypothetical protein
VNTNAPEPYEFSDGVLERARARLAAAGKEKP